MKKFVIIFIVVVLLAVLAVFSPWKNLDLSLESIFNINNPNSQSSLEVSSLGGKISIFVDNVELGQTTVEEPKFVISPVSSGIREVKLQRVSDVKYTNFVRDINFEENITTSISWENGLTDETSSGWVLEPTKNITSQDTLIKLNFSILPLGATITMDGTKVETKSVDIDPAKKYEIKVEKEGYLPLSFSLFGFDDSNNENLKGYDFNLEVKLAEIPIKVEEVND